MQVLSNVTVVIPCFNDGKYIIEALNSIWNQTLKAEKIIIVDDGSDEKTKTILKSISNDKAHIVFQDNQGVSKARNVGIALAITDYILTLDADDYFEPTFIEKAIKILDENDQIAAVCSWVEILINNKIEPEIKKPLGGGIKDFIVKNNAVSGAMFRKKCWQNVGGYDEKMVNGYEDWEFWIAILKQNRFIHIIQEPLFTYRQKNRSRDKTAIKKFDFELRKYMFLKHKEVYETYFEFYAIELLRRSSALKNKVNKTETSKEYKIGQLILTPIKILKKCFN